MGLETLRSFFVILDRQDKYGKASFEKEINERGFPILVTDSRAFRFYELLSELCECMVFDSVNGEKFSWVFQAVHQDFFFTKKPREVTEEEFREELQKNIFKNAVSFKFYLLVTIFFLELILFEKLMA